MLTICKIAPIKFYLFADDTNLLHADRNLKSLETVFNCELLSVYNWLIANKLSLNIEKCNFFIFLTVIIKGQTTN